MTPPKSETIIVMAPSPNSKTVTFPLVTDKSHISHSTDQPSNSFIVSFCTVRTSFERFLLFFISLLSVVFLVLLIFLFRSSSFNRPNTSTFSSNVCHKAGCIKAASEILSLIDESVSPCEDFYRFACGGWLSQTAIPGETGDVSNFEQSRERLHRQLKTLIETSNHTTPAMVAVKKMYRSCMNLSAIEKLGMKPLERALKHLGGWPVVEGDTWNESTFDWINVTMKIRSMGYIPNMFADFSVITDPRNNTGNILLIGEAVLGLRRQLLSQGPDHQTVRVYHQLMVDTAMLLGAKNKTRVETEMWEVLAFETIIANATHDPQIGEENSYYVTLSNEDETEGNNETGHDIDWVRFVNAAIDMGEMEAIGPNEVVMLENLPFLEQMEGLLASNQDNKRLLANYMLWRLVQQTLPTGNRVMRDLPDNLDKHLYGTSGKIPRWKVCLYDLIDDSMAMAISALYIKHHFTEETRERASEMVHLIKNEFDHILHKTEWMDSETKEKAYKKSKEMTSIVGYPKELANDDALQEHFQGLQLTWDNFEDNIRRLRIWEHQNEFKKLRGVNNPRNWKNFANIASVNAFYLPSANTIIIPAGILRDFFFDNDRPAYLNFGTLGYIIGHEVTHAFDKVGAEYDGLGNVRNWWKNETKNHYNGKIQCMVKQYEDYQLSSQGRISGELTLDENIADNGGIREAFQAYEKYSIKFGPELPLPGLKYSPRQLFFIAAATNWCSKSLPEILQIQLDTDTHSPSEARINIPFGNYDAFSEAFQCEPGSKSNPIHKCTVW